MEQEVGVREHCGCLPTYPSYLATSHFHAHGPRIQLLTLHIPGAEDPKPKDWFLICSTVIDSHEFIKFLIDPLLMGKA